MNEDNRSIPQIMDDMAKLVDGLLSDWFTFKEGGGQ